MVGVGKQARSQSSGHQARGAMAGGDEAATLPDEEQPGSSDLAGAAGATQTQLLGRALGGNPLQPLEQH